MKKKQALLVSGLCLGLSAVMLTGTTLAWFTDSVSNTGNTIQAGTMKVDFMYRDLKLTGGTGYEKMPDQADEAGALFTSKQIWEPGYSYGYDFKVRNSGEYGKSTLAFKHRLEMTNIQITGDADIAEVLNVYVIGRDDTTLDEEDCVGTLAQLREDPVVYTTSKTAMEVGWEDFFTVVIEMDPEAGNAYQGCGVTFDLNLVAKQATGEKEIDGFGSNQYDADATYETETTQG